MFSTSLKDNNRVELNPVLDCSSNGLFLSANERAREKIRSVRDLQPEMRQGYSRSASTCFLAHIKLLCVLQ